MSTKEKKAPQNNVSAMTSTRMSDEQLVDGLCAGDMVATGAFYDRYHKRIFSRVWRTMGRDDEAEDLVQVIFEQLFGSISRLKKVESLDAWVSAVTCRSVYKELRRRQYRRILFFVPRPEETPSGELGPEADLVFLRASAVLRLMKPMDQLIFVLRFVEESSHGEIAAATGLSESTVKRRIVRCKEQFLKRAGRDSVLASYMEGDGHVP